MTSQEKLQIIIEAQDRTNKAVEKIAQQMDMADKKTKAFQGTLTKLGGVVATAFAVSKLKDFAVGAVQAGLQGEQVAESFYRMAAAAGTAGDELVAALERASAGTVDQTSIMLAANRSMALNVTADIGQMTKLMEIARVRGRAMGQDTTQSFNDIVTGIGRASPMILDNLGIITKGWAEEAAAAGVAYDAQFILNKVLAQGTVELDALGEVQLTAAERVAQLNARYVNFQDSLGRAFLPTLEVVMDSIMGVTEDIATNQARMDAWAKTIYRVTNFVIAMGKAAKVVIDVLTALGDIIWSIAKMAASPFKALAQALTGDFDAAWDTLSTSAENGWEEVSNKTKAWGEVISGDFASVGESAVRAIDLEGFTPLADRVNKMTGQISKAVTKMADTVNEEALKEAAEATKKLSDAFSDMVDSVDDSLFEMRQSHREKLSGIRKEIDGVKAKIRDLNDEYAKTRGDNTRDVAASVVENETRMAEIQKELASGVSADRRKELEAELTQRQASVIANADFIKSIDREVVEARRVAGLTDLQRSIEEYQAKQAAALDDYNKRREILDTELKDAKKRKREEEDLYQEKLVFIQSALEQILAAGQATAASNVLATKEQVETEIQYYQKLAEAIKAARSGNASEVARISSKVSKISAPARAQGGPVMKGQPYWVGERGPELFMPNSGGKIIPNGSAGGPTYNIIIQGNSFLGKEDVARQIGNQLMREMQMRQKLKY